MVHVEADNLTFYPVFILWSLWFGFSKSREKKTPPSKLLGSASRPWARAEAELWLDNCCSEEGSDQPIDVPSPSLALVVEMRCPSIWWLYHFCSIPHSAVPEEVHLAVHYQQQPDVSVWWVTDSSPPAALLTTVITCCLFALCCPAALELLWTLSLWLMSGTSGFAACCTQICWCL